MTVDKNVRLSRCEYWILNQLAHLCFEPFWFDDRHAGGALNTQSHGLDNSQLAATLHYHYSKDWIRFETFDEQPLHFSLEDIVAAIEPKENQVRSFACITELGGAIWESFAKPNWGTYLQHHGSVNSDDETEEIEILATDRRKIDSYLLLLDQYFENGQFWCVDRSTLREELLSPFNVTYWKQLPQGYRLTFRMIRRESDAVSDYEKALSRSYDLSDLCEFRRWYAWD
ncbi:hypothetical protein KIH39_11000 [Telmatocola sphagniphila]|uniref:Uncharacterized protein n=1 Tax=Telmatocola sphagniphila TaxID=1123043 RepID=A0A8E6BAR5_9BACT|nr:hypothetical protein [Telmatocola sphagniphila]QVL34404.1 hypothetical protein KIH39_11000 [Telmatocola sphagniphila]